MVTEHINKGWLNLTDRIVIDRNIPWPKSGLPAFNECFVCAEQVLGRETDGELAYGFQSRLDWSGGLRSLRRPSRTDRRETEYHGQSWVISVRRGR